MRYVVAIPLCLAVSIAIAGPAGAAAPIVGDGLKVSTGSAETWSPWQARLAMAAPAVPLLGGAAGPSTSATMLAGDRYFGWGRLGDGGGLRATGALLLGSGSLAPLAPAGRGEALWRGIGGTGLADPEAPGAVPYLGLGYSAWWAKSGIGVSADLGLAAQRPGQAVRFGRVVQGSESLDEMLHAMQISPMLQVNLSYAF